jgi:hypothetical protein
MSLKSYPPLWFRTYDPKRLRRLELMLFKTKLGRKQLKKAGRLTANGNLKRKEAI